MELHQTSASPITQLILASPNSGAKLLVVSPKKTSIGRDDGNDVVLDSPLASRRHAVLLIDGPSVTLQDLGSRNGTFVNGCRVDSRVLANRDLIEIGDCVLRFLVPTSRSRAAASRPAA